MYCFKYQKSHFKNIHFTGMKISQVNFQKIYKVLVKGITELLCFNMF